jgi:ferredoxin
VHHCLACARACPIDCIEMEAVRHGKELEWISFTLDYQKCMFCELCVYPCPKDCIHMGTEFAFVSFDRSEFKHDLLSYKGMAKEARIRMREAEAKKAAKEPPPALQPELPRAPGDGGLRARSRLHGLLAVLALFFVGGPLHGGEGSPPALRRPDRRGRSPSGSSVVRSAFSSSRRSGVAGSSCSSRGLLAIAQSRSVGGILALCFRRCSPAG